MLAGAPCSIGRASVELDVKDIVGTGWPCFCDAAEISFGASVKLAAASIVCASAGAG